MQAPYQRFVKAGPGAMKGVKDGITVMPEKFRPRLLEKKWKAKKFEDVVSSARFYAVFHCHQIPDYEALRQTISAQGGKLFIIKNVLARKVCESAGIPALKRMSGLFQGPSIFVYLDPDTSSTTHLFHKDARYGETAITKLSRTLERNPDFMYLGGSLDGTFIDRRTFLPLMKEKDLSGIQMLGSTLASLPHLKLVQALQSHQSEMVRVLKERSIQLGESS